VILRSKGFVIAIDGPAASGKSTTARLVAAALGYVHVDTGAMYRALTLKALRQGISPEDQEAVSSIAESSHVDLRVDGGTLRVLLDGEDVSEAIRTPDVTAAVSLVSSYQRVRAAMVREQRLMGEQGGIVMDGRDIGTVVFPDADVKFFMVAGIKARARRRSLELRARGIEADETELEEQIAGRDLQDSTREQSPLRRAGDAIDVDTSELTIEEQVAYVVRRTREAMERGRMK
jgi:cytidylate kinase